MAGGTGEKRQVGGSVGRGRGVFGDSGRACGGAEGLKRFRAPALIEVVFWKGLGLGGIELGRLVEVVGEGFLGDLFCFRAHRPDIEFGLGRPPGGMEEWG